LSGLAATWAVEELGLSTIAAGGVRIGTQVGVNAGIALAASALSGDQLNYGEAFMTTGFSIFAEGMVTGFTYHESTSIAEELVKAINIKPMEYSYEKIREQQSHDSNSNSASDARTFGMCQYNAGSMNEVDSSGIGGNYNDGLDSGDQPDGPY